MQQKVTKAEGRVGRTDKGWSWEAFLRKQNYIFLFINLGYFRTVSFLYNPKMFSLPQVYKLSSSNFSFLKI